MLLSRQSSYVVVLVGCPAGQLQPSHTFLTLTVRCAQATVLMALLQPAPEVYQLFDDIMLLSEGHIVYFGPKEEVSSPHESASTHTSSHKAVHGGCTGRHIRSIEYSAMPDSWQMSAFDLDVGIGRISVWC